MGGTVVRVRGIKVYRSKGRTYAYHRKTGERVEAEIGTPAFFKRIQELELQAASIEAAKRDQPLTLKALILQYRQEKVFTELAPRTKADYEKVFAFFEPIYNQPVALFTHETIVGLRKRWQKERGYRFVNLCLMLLRQMFTYAKDECLIDKNPTIEVKSVRRPKGLPQVNRPWSLAEREAVQKRTLEPRWQHLRLPFMLALHLGLREGDVLRLPRNVVKGGVLSYETRKRQVPVDLAVRPELDEAIKNAPPHNAITLVANSRGVPWTESGFRASWNRMIKGLENEGLLAPGCTFHGLRHSLASDIAEHEEGFGEHDIAAVLGQRTATSSRVYTARAQRGRRARAVLAKIQPLKPKE
jgi:integrase